MTPEKAFKLFIVREPFYGLLLTNLQKEYTTNPAICKTAHVSFNNMQFCLCINTTFWDELSDDEQLAILKHEVLHICFKHLYYWDRFSNKVLGNLATDCEVNQYITNLPEGCVDINILKQKLPEWKNAPYKAGSKVYYDLFNQSANNLAKQLSQQQTSSSQNKSSSDSNQSDDLLDTLLSQAEVGNKRGEHKWKKIDSKSAQGQLLSNQIDNLVKKTAEVIQKSRGVIPGELSEYIDSLFVQKEAVFNWKAYLRRFIGNAIQVYTKKSKRKESLRFQTDGLKLKKKHTILVGVDTSGSVDARELCDFFSEINHIKKSGIKIDLAQFDTNISSIEPYKGVIPTIVGRGGTNFGPIIEYYNNNRNKYTTMVLFTDGEAPINYTLKKRMLWIISSKGNIEQNYPGLAIQIPKNHN